MDIKRDLRHLRGRARTSCVEGEACMVGLVRKGNGMEKGRNAHSQCFGEHCAVHIQVLVARNTSLEPPSTGAAIGTTLTVFWEHRETQSEKEMKR